MKDYKRSENEKGSAKNLSNISLRVDREVNRESVDLLDNSSISDVVSSASNVFAIERYSSSCLYDFEIC